MKKLILLLAGSLMVVASSQAAVIANLHNDFNTAIAGVANGDTLNSTSWTLAGSDGSQLTWSTADLGGNRVSGFAHPTNNQFASRLPAVSTGDFYDGGTVTANHLAMHSSDAVTLVITWTADQDYTDLSVNYFYDRRGNSGAANSGTSTLTIGGTAGVGIALSALATESDGTTNTVANVTTGQTITFTVTGAGSGEAYANFVVDATPTPEPSSTALLGLGGLALILRRSK